MNQNDTQAATPPENYSNIPTDELLTRLEQFLLVNTHPETLTLFSEFEQRIIEHETLKQTAKDYLHAVTNGNNSTEITLALQELMQALQDK